MDAGFLYAFANALSQNALENIHGPNYYVEGWRDFLKGCIEGYSYSLFDYDYDINFRSEIELLIKSPILQEFSEFVLFKAKINEIDKGLKSITMDRPNMKQKNLPWWENIILRYSGPEYAKNILDIYGLRIDIV